MSRKIIYFPIVKVFLLFSLVFQMINFANAKTQVSGWKIMKTQWDYSDEVGFQNFVSRIYTGIKNKECLDQRGENELNTIRGCLRNAELNPYRNIDLQKVGPRADYFAATDCSKCPVYLRAYYAYQNNLPLTLVKEVAPAGPKTKTLPNGEVKEVNRDVRYGWRGSEVVSRFYARTGFNPWQGRRDNIFLNNWFYVIHTGMLRFGPTNTDYEISDYYSLNIFDTPVLGSTLTPGVMWYEPHGHASMVGEVRDDGTVKFLNCGIDAAAFPKTLTNTEGNVVSRSNRVTGGGFKGFRPIQIVGARKVEEGNYAGSYIGGSYKVLTDNEINSLYKIRGIIASYQKIASTEQYDFQSIYSKPNRSYVEWVSFKITGEWPSVDPVREMSVRVGQICDTLDSRKGAVERALNAKEGRSLETDYEGKLPSNIYGTHGFWETYSTPGRDVGLRKQFSDLYKLVEDLIEWKTAGDLSRVNYRGSLERMKSEMKEALEESMEDCDLSYVNSNDEEVKIDIKSLIVKGEDETRPRIFRLSFDPYHCAERRWGAAPNSEEGSTCGDDEIKTAWYKAQQNLRHVLERSSADNMNLPVNEVSSLGTTKVPKLNVFKLLQ